MQHAAKHGPAHKWRQHLRNVRKWNQIWLWMILNSHKITLFSSSSHFWLVSDFSRKRCTRARWLAHQDIKTMTMTRNSFLNQDLNTWRDAWMEKPKHQNMMSSAKRKKQQHRRQSDTQHTCHTGCATHAARRKRPTKKVFYGDMLPPMWPTSYIFRRAAMHVRRLHRQLA